MDQFYYFIRLDALPLQTFPSDVYQPNTGKRSQ
jgi:hypothetical protein